MEEMAAMLIAAENSNSIIKRNIVIILLIFLFPLVEAGCSQESVEYGIDSIKKVAEKGDIKAQIELGFLYYEGKEVPQDKALAAHWFLKAAEQGDMLAQHYMGWMYAKADGVERNIEKAICWYTKAAENGHLDSMVNLGNIYLREKDYTKALKWYELAANKGDQYAQYELGVMYRLGEGISQDTEKAKALFLKAAEQGNENAEKALVMLDEEARSDEYTQKRMDDVFLIAGLLEEYKAIAGHYPFYDPTPAEEGYVKTGTLVTLASPEAEKQLKERPNPFGISATRAYACHLNKELAAILKRKIHLPVDPQKVAMYAPNAYYVYFPPAKDDEYLIITFLYSPNSYTTELFNSHANVYSIASSSAVGEELFWKSAGIKLRIYKDIENKEKHITANKSN